MDKTPKPKNGRRRPPADMPREVETIRRSYVQPPKRDTLPAQKALTDEPEAKRPAKWKAVVRKLLLLLLLILALAFLYLFLLMGEPDDDDEVLLKQSAAQEEIIRMPMTGQEMTGTVDVNAAAVSFGKDVMELRGNVLPLLKAALYDTAYGGGYARRLTLTYQFPDGSVMTVDSIRPAGAITLLTDSGYALRVDTLYTMAGLDAVRMDSKDYIRVAAAGEDAVYVAHIPMSQEKQLADYLRTLGLIRADGQ